MSPSDLFNSRTALKSQSISAEYHSGPSVVTNSMPELDFDIFCHCLEPEFFVIPTPAAVAVAVEFDQPTKRQMNKTPCFNP
jgi:hypothetical protein